MWKEIFIETNSFENMYNESSFIGCGDSIELLKKMKDKTVDLIFADPPYNIGKDFGKVKEKEAWKTKEDYIKWCKYWIDECFRVLKDDGTFYFMTATQFISYLDIYVQENYNVLSRIVWSYDSSGVQSKKIFGSLYEPILMVNKSPKAKYTFNYKDILVEAKTGAKRGLIDYRKDPPQPYNTKKVPGNVWEFPRVRYKMEEYENHPTQKPEKLLERIILASSNEGDIVLDPFGGSFTTAGVAVKLNRKAVSFDIEEEYFKIGIRRTGIATHYKGEELKKDKSRKTKNLSKNVRT
ncbi:adenine-specific DNA-methyltransferase, partial [Pallidibacillus pasinlerensis]